MTLKPLLPFISLKKWGFESGVYSPDGFDKTGPGQTRGEQPKMDQLSLPRFVQK
jgi:hypothetical protein